MCKLKYRGAAQKMKPVGNTRGSGSSQEFFNILTWGPGNRGGLYELNIIITSFGKIMVGEGFTEPMWWHDPLFPVLGRLKQEALLSSGVRDHLEE